jgi:hypothetical protein
MTEQQRAAWRRELSWNECLACRAANYHASVNGIGATTCRTICSAHYAELTRRNTAPTPPAMELTT